MEVLLSAAHLPEMVEGTAGLGRFMGLAGLAVTLGMAGRVHLRGKRVQAAVVAHQNRLMAAAVAALAFLDKVLMGPQAILAEVGLTGKMGSTPAVTLTWEGTVVLLAVAVVGPLVAQ